MASQVSTAMPTAGTIRSDYCAEAGPGDVMCAGDESPWDIILDEVLKGGGGDLARTEDRLRRQVQEIGTSFRLSGEMEERQWPVSPLPLVIEEREWGTLAAAITQRAELCELLLQDIYGQQRLVAGGVLPASALTGSEQFLRPMTGIAPPGGHYLHVYAADLGRGPNGNWRVIADHTRSPAGAGYALENRLAASQVLGALSGRLNIQRLAPFFADLREGIAAACKRTDPRMALLTPGRFNQSYAEQAHLARYLGMLLVEGADLAVHDDCLYLRTIEGLKRVDALWQRMDARMIDPLALDSRSEIGVPGLVDAIAAGDTVVGNFPGSAVLEAPLFAAFMPRLAQRMTGETLKLPNIATWWCGQDKEADHIRENFDRYVVAPAFGPAASLGERGERVGAELSPDERAHLLADMERRPLDFIGQEVVQLSTMPVTEQGRLVPRPFTLRMFAARNASGGWTVMPGGFVRMGPEADVRATSIGAGTRSADVIVRGEKPVAPVTLMTDGNVAIRRNPGTLPSRVADNLFWLGRYVERGEAVLALVRTGSAGATEGDANAVADATTLRICSRLIADEAVNGMGTTRPAEMFAAALDDASATSSVVSLLAAARTIGGGSRERISPDFWNLLAAPFPEGLFQERNLVLKARFAAFAGLAAEHMGRTAGWRFHDLGRRVERALSLSRLIAEFASEDASANDLSVLLDLCDAQIMYRQRYSTGLALLPVRDLVGLDPYNPRSISFQIKAIAEHLEALPRLKDDGMAEDQEKAAGELVALMTTMTADGLTPQVCFDLQGRLMAVSNAISHRFFLRGSEALRASGMTLA